MAQFMPRTAHLVVVDQGTKFIDLATEEGIKLKYEYMPMTRQTLANVNEDLAKLERLDDFQGFETATRNNAKHALRCLIVQLIKHKIF